MAACVPPVKKPWQDGSGRRTHPFSGKNAKKKQPIAEIHGTWGFDLLSTL